MKKLFIPALILVFCGSLVSAADINGKWKGSVDTDQGPFEFTITFMVEGDSLSGSISSDYMDMDIYLSGNKLSVDEFEYTFEVNGYVISQQGKLVSDDEILVTYQDEYGENQIRLTRIPEE